MSIHDEIDRSRVRFLKTLETMTATERDHLLGMESLAELPKLWETAQRERMVIAGAIEAHANSRGQF